MSNEADNRRVTNTCRYQNCVCMIEKGEHKAMLRGQRRQQLIAAVILRYFIIIEAAKFCYDELKVYKGQPHKATNQREM